MYRITWSYPLLIKTGELVLNQEISFKTPLGTIPMGVYTKDSGLVGPTPWLRVLVNPEEVELITMTVFLVPDGEAVNTDDYDYVGMAADFSVWVRRPHAPSL